MSNHKRTILIVAILALLVLIGFILASALREKKEKEKIEESTTSFVSISENSDEEELVATGPTGPTEIDDGYTYRVTITNIADLTATGIQTIALDCIEPYLNEYFNYYLQDGNHYDAVYVADSYIESYNIPQFQVYIEELDLEIDCMCILSEKYYRFRSRFNPEWE